MTKEPAPIREMTLKEILNLDEEKYTDGEIIDLVFDWEKQNTQKMDGIKIAAQAFKQAADELIKAMEDK